MPTCNVIMSSQWKWQNSGGHNQSSAWRSVTKSLPVLVKASCFTASHKPPRDLVVLLKHVNASACGCSAEGSEAHCVTSDPPAAEGGHRRGCIRVPCFARQWAWVQHPNGVHTRAAAAIHGEPLQQACKSSPWGVLSRCQELELNSRIRIWDATIALYD